MRRLPAAVLPRALEFLCRSQLASGELRTYIAANPALSGECAFDSSPFVTAIAVHALSFVDQPAVLDLRRKAVAFLRSEGEAPGAWRYWTARSGKSIAPDVDDTALVSHALRHPAAGGHRYDNRALLLANRNAAGLFYTWLKGYGEKNDIDSVVNANVVLYLGDCEETVAACEHLTRAVRRAGEGPSYWYYLNDLALHYAVSRAIFHGVARLAPLRSAILDAVLRRQDGDGAFGDELSTALAVCTLLNLGSGNLPAADLGIDHLIAMQHEDGSWRRIAYYCGPEPPSPRSRWFGSEEAHDGALRRGVGAI